MVFHDKPSIFGIPPCKKEPKKKMFPRNSAIVVLGGHEALEFHETSAEGGARVSYWIVLPISIWINGVIGQIIQIVKSIVVRMESLLWLFQAMIFWCGCEGKAGGLRSARYSNGSTVNLKYSQQYCEADIGRWFPRLPNGNFLNRGTPNYP